jgi:DNA polymerase delta subunit 1
LEKRQLAIKIAGNSIYGFLAAYALPLIQGAMATTWTGRQLITTVNDYLLKHYPDCRIIYNDTDSVMVDMRITDPKDCDRIGNKLADEITSLFPDPVKLEFEKAMRILNLMKKKYAYFNIKKDGSIDYNINRKGILTARRDNCSWMRDMYDTALLSILKKEELETTFKIVFDALEKLQTNTVNPEDLCIVRSLGANYKAENYFMKVFADELRKKNKPVNPGDRLKYLLLDKPEEEHRGKKMILLEDFLENPEKIDHQHYISLIGSHLEQLFTIAFPEHFERLTHIKFKPPGRRNAIGLNKFIEIYKNLENKELLKKHLLNPEPKIMIK